MDIIKNIIFLINKYGNLFLIGTGYTLLLSLITVFFGTILGSVLAMLKNNRFWLVRFIVSAYIEIVRGTPILLQLCIFTFLIPLHLY